MPSSVPGVMSAVKRRVGLALRLVLAAVILFVTALMVVRQPVGAQVLEEPVRPANGKIAFVSSRDLNEEIYAADPDGSGPSNLTQNPAADGKAAWSADGSKIAFTSERDGNPEIYVMNADGTGLTRLTHHPAIDTDPVWSPRGTKIAFTSWRDRNAEIYTMNPDGGGLRNITRHPAVDTQPAWSSEEPKTGNNSLAFTSLRSGNGDIYVTDGRPAKRLTSSPEPDFAPAWSPDRSRIAFTRDLGNNLEVFIINADGSDQMNVTNHPAQDMEPVWSPESGSRAFSQIAFATNRDGNFEIYTITLTTPEGARTPDILFPTNLTNNPADDILPSWQPKL
jgi:Tol biopolymer transport system component